MTLEEYGDKAAERDYELFPFRREEVFLVEELKARFRYLLSKSNVSPNQLREIGTVLFTLERLPRSTPGVFVVIGPHYSLSNESSYCDLCISESEFSLSQGGSVYDPGVGSHHYSSTAFEIETSGYRNGSGDHPDVRMAEQVDELVNLGANLSVEYLGDDDQVDWTEDFSDEYWDELFEDS